MLEKKQIVESIAATAKSLGQAPSLVQFVARAGIPKRSVFRHFPKWNDAVRAAGLQPCRLYARPKDTELLEDWGKTVRKTRGIPTRRVYRLEGKYYPLTLERRFGGWAWLPEAFRKFAKGEPEWTDVLELLRASARKKRRLQPIEDSFSSRLPNEARHAPLRDRTMCGSPIDFRGLRHEPVNEQGVVFLFGMLAKELGYMVEALQKGFPDCEAKRQIAADRWQRVNIEFEFESKNFRDHGHPLNGCDVIVCWRHNWEECPKHLEVLELSRVVRCAS
jgi:hypothetical protein